MVKTTTGTTGRKPKRKLEYLTGYKELVPDPWGLSIDANFTDMEATTTITSAAARPVKRAKPSADPSRKYRIIKGKKYWFLKGKELVPDPFGLEPA